MPRRGPTELQYRIKVACFWCCSIRQEIRLAFLNTSNGKVFVTCVISGYHTHTHLDCIVGTTDRFLSSMSPFMCVESNSDVADPGAAAARPGTRVVEWLCAELPDCSSMLESWDTHTHTHTHTHTNTLRHTTCIWCNRCMRQKSCIWRRGPTAYVQNLT